MLKSKTITTDKATLLLVEIPDGTEYLATYDSKRGELIGIDYSTNQTTLKRWLCPMEIEGKFKILGCLPKVTEEQAEKVVESEDFKHYSGEYFHMFVDYNNCENAFDDALESLHSLLQANEVYFENSIKHPRQMNMHPASVGWYNRQVQVYEEAQSKVWDKERTYLFIKVD